MYEALNEGTAVYGVNVFSDLTQEEFKSTFVCQSTYIEGCITLSSYIRRLAERYTIASCVSS